MKEDELAGSNYANPCEIIDNLFVGSNNAARNNRSRMDAVLSVGSEYELRRVYPHHHPRVAHAQVCIEDTSDQPMHEAFDWTSLFIDTMLSE
jgi:hypothetical protein